MAKDSNIAIKVENVSKTFKLPHEKSSSLKSAFLNKVKQKKGYEIQEALKNVSFEVKKGEFFGIVGRNGSGKSTLLKCLAGVYTPNKGKVHINGTLVPFIELGVGFNPELSGRDNVFLNGALLGFSRKQMGDMYNEIVEFAELEKFMDQKLKNYSSGMQVRLAFSIAIRAKADILVLDEVLAVGDESFREKCEAYFREVKRMKKTIILVSHSMKSVQEFCTRVLVLNDGEVYDSGDPEEMAAIYSQLNMDTLNKPHTSLSAANTPNDAKVRIKKVKTLNADGFRSSVFRPNETIVVYAEIEPLADEDDVSIGFRLYGEGSPSLVASNTKSQDLEIIFKKDRPIYLQWEIPAIFNNGVYSVGIKVYSPKSQEVFIKDTQCHSLGIKGWDDPYHLTHIKTKLSIVDRLGNV